MKKTLQILIVEDEKIMRVSLADDLREAGYNVLDFEDPIEALGKFQDLPIDVVITDINMPKMDGIQLLSKIKSLKPDTIVIVITAYSSVGSAVEALKKGAYDYITKPFRLDEILLILERVKELQNIRQENVHLRALFNSQYNLSSFVGDGPAVKKTRELVSTVADSSTTVLIEGETGTGKELLANIIHFNSDRQKKRLVKVSCAILSKTVFESELFGHEKGAFTGATNERRGRFELAENGTLFLDDIEDIPLELQVKLLRVLQEKEIERVGGNKTIKTDVRVIAATKVNLKTLVENGKFREDLYYRLNIFPIHLKPLRERKEDIPLLVHHFIKEYNSDLNVSFQTDAMNCLVNYDWPGNVRELKNSVERLTLLANGGQIDISKIPAEIIGSDNIIPENWLGKKPLNEIIDDIEANIIRQALFVTNDHQTRASKILGIPSSTLRTKMNKYGLESGKR